MAIFIHPKGPFFYYQERVKPWTHSQIIEHQYYRPMFAHLKEESEQYYLQQLSEEILRPVTCPSNEITLQILVDQRRRMNETLEEVLKKQNCGICYYPDNICKKDNLCKPKQNSSKALVKPKL